MYETPDYCNEIATLKQRIKALEAEMSEQTKGGLLYITAILAHAVGVGVQIRFSDEDMKAACNLQLERADPEDGGLVLRVVEPERPPEEPPKSAIITSQDKVLAKAERPIILLDTQRTPNE